MFMSQAVLMKICLHSWLVNQVSNMLTAGGGGRRESDLGVELDKAFALMWHTDCSPEA